MKNLWKNQPNYFLWIGLLILAVTVFMLGFGRKEERLYQEFQEKVRQEQKSMLSPETKKEKEEDGDGQNKAEGNAAAEVENGEKKSHTISSMVLKGPDRIRVMLQNNEGSSYCHEQMILQAACDMELTGAVNMVCPPGTPVDMGQILPDEGRVTVQAAVPEEKLTVASMKRAQGVPSYEGSLTVWREGEGFCILNTVDLETYLKYVVPSEMPSGYPEEALKAQAVCARTYAVSQIREARLAASYEADVDDSVSFQVYNNIDRQETTDRAVEETRGKVMSNQGEPIQAYFFSTSCGHTSTDEVWETDAPASYLKSAAVSGQAVEAAAAGTAGETDLSREENFRAFISGKNQDDYENGEVWYRWSITLPWRMIQERAEEKWPQIGDVQTMTVEERSTGGAAKQLAVQGTEDTGRLTNEYAIREFLSPGDIPVICNDGSGNRSMSILPSAYICIDPQTGEEGTSGFFIQGGGYGHGVGMSQNGAKYLAKSGLGYQDILEMFFQNFDLSVLEN